MPAESLTIDTSSSKVSFSVKKLGMITIKGMLSDLKGQISFEENDMSNSYFDVCLSAVCVDTGNQKRDEHLKSKDFFFVKEFPVICFKSTSVHKVNGSYKAKGKLSILSTTNDIEIPFEYKNEVFNGQFSLNPMDYNLGSKFPAFIVGKTIQISINCKIK